MTPPPVQPNQSVLEGIDLLLLVARRRQPVRVRPLARELGMTPTRLQRYLATLAHAGLLQRTPNASYGVGPGIHALSGVALSASGLTARALDVLPDLSDLGCTVALGVLWRKTVSYLYFHHPDEPVVWALGHTEAFPAEQSVIGQVMLAEQPEDTVRKELGETAEAILPVLRHVRNDRCARMERSDRETSLAVPVGCPVIAGLALTGSLEDEPLALARLREAADLLTPKGSK